MASFVDLCTNKELINANFDHYQLCLDAVPVYNVKLEKNIDVAKPSELMFSSHHAKLFSLHNSLFSDPWDDQSVYFCDKEWNIGKAHIVKANRLDNCESMFQVPEAANLRLSPSRFNVSVVFPHKNMAVVGNGVDKVYLLETGDRSSNKTWKCVFSESLVTSGQPCQLVDAVVWSVGENHRVDFLLASVEEVEGEVKERYGSPYISVLDWITILSVDKCTWNVERSRRLEASRTYDYACLDRDGSSVHIVSSKFYKLVADSVKPVDNSEPWEVLGDNEGVSTPLYTWSETASDATIHLTIPEGLTKANLSVGIMGDRIEVGIKNGVDMIKGPLHARVEVDGSTWTLDGRRLEITLEKVEEEMWGELVKGDSRGELVLSPEQIEAIHKRLAHLTSEHWNPNPEAGDKPFNSQMLEECDAVDEDGVVVMRMDGDTHQISHKVIANNQFMFTAALEAGSLPAFVLRHDVDAFLWQASGPVQPEKCPWQHIGVLNAIGYVSASKQQRRFSACSPDMSVAVIADSKRHIYVYRQKVSVLSPLRNRKTGQQINTVAKQQVLSLDCTPDVILGIRVTNKKILVATEQQVWMYVMTPDE